MYFFSGFLFSLKYPPFFETYILDLLYILRLWSKIKVKIMRKIIHMFWKQAVIFLWVPGILFSLVSCRKSTPPVEIPKLVKTAVVGEQAGELSVTYPGKVAAASNVKLAFRVAGPIKAMKVNSGQYVKKGQLLAELDPRDYVIQFNATQAEYNQVKGESDRVIELYRRGSVSVNEYDKAVAAKKRVTALYQAHRNALKDTRLLAPFDGYIQNKYFEAPEIVNQGTPVVSMIDNDYYEVNIDIPSSDFIRREDFVSYQAVADVYPGQILPLELLDITQGANYNQLFNVRFRVRRDSFPWLASGMSVSVTIHFKPSAGELSTIPISALLQKAGKSYVWLYHPQDSLISLTPVEVQQIMKNGTAIIRSELERGQTIISAGVNDLKEGEKVRLLPPVPSSNVGGLL